ncbi:hypothetical protein M0L39_RS06400 [Providencia rettgeri]|uniref:hypothetical protein n=1 Tax=Providencia rettgeri TaxID=587 RepID=UPI0005B4CC07|nr:hypothetical protein CEQ08_02740 [Providencia rettgeri]EJD6599567.1 hypothetical protein [Providencia rettgeri]MBX7010452.1 hypothetical protein [Providencia rettgeri]RXN71341.1 hypothetical protein D0Z62_09510 [Providencia rettgeri]HCI95812.1 hypothetical protein [Providencia sp.]
METFNNDLNTFHHYSLINRGAFSWQGDPSSWLLSITFTMVERVFVKRSDYQINQHGADD